MFCSDLACVPCRNVTMFGLLPAVDGQLSKEKCVLFQTDDFRYLAHLMEHSINSGGGFARFSLV